MSTGIAEVKGSLSSLPKLVSQTVIEETKQHRITITEMAQGAFFQIPIQPNSENSVTILSGTGTMKIENEIKEVSPYTTVKCTAGKIDTFINNQKETLKLLCVSGCEGQRSEEASKEVYVRKMEDCKLFIGAKGESIFELFGAFNGNGKNHSIAVVKIDEGCSSPMHHHPKIEEGYYMTKGKARLILDNKVTILQPGDFAKIPVGKTHQIFNDEKPLLEFIAVCSPPWTPDCAVYE